ncbi:sensor domain-containing diguanylate cyclase [Ideonella sp. BN130291]|uniref:sensor domain-containing diguanylate cyclase n=1 Tax=Ideonella sp. BN130291 TaxID=3112940 RepID=UPI002E265575|nr:diguanylate cyclase [Ideonella sp. BN130291]MED5619986.1 diguanylate cyclase [Ideonella sp. BN130291]
MSLAPVRHDPEDQRRVHTETLVDAIDLPIGRWSQDGRLVFCNAPYEAWALRDRAALIGRSLAELYGHDAWHAAQPAFAQAFEGRTVSYERRLTHRGGRWARIQVFPDFRPDGSVEAVYTIAFDIHDDVEQRKALQDANRRLDRFTENIPYPLTYIDRDCVVRFANKAYLQVAGQTADQVVDRHIGEVRGRKRWEEHEPFFQRALGGEMVQYTRLVDWPKLGRRWVRTSYVPDFDAEHRVVGLYTVTTDVHELTVAQERLKRSVEVDALTEVYSRRAMMDRIDAAVLNAADHPAALFFIDLDGFKAVNDACGHREGDRVLCAIAQALKEAVRTEDSVGRFGGDEFLVLAPVHDRQGAHVMALHLLEAVRAAGALAAPQHRVTASIGYALTPLDATQPLKLIQLADGAMYAAKRLGQNRVLSGMAQATPWPLAS